VIKTIKKQLKPKEYSEARKKAEEEKSGQKILKPPISH